MKLFPLTMYALTNQLWNERGNLFSTKFTEAKRGRCLVYEHMAALKPIFKDHHQWSIIYCLILLFSVFPSLNLTVPVTFNYFSTMLYYYIQITRVSWIARKVKQISLVSYHAILTILKSIHLWLLLVSMQTCCVQN